MSAVGNVEERADAPAIRAVRLSKWYGRVTALQEVSLHLDAGAWGLLGPNGSGKTTLMHLVAGHQRPSLGEVRVCGAVPFANPFVLRRLGLCPEADALYDELTGLELVAAMAELSGFSRSEARDRAASALGAFGLRADMERPIQGYSRGMRQRVKLAQTIVHEPDVLVLDEPLTGTDPTSRAVILDEVRARIARGALVLFSTHVLHEVEALTDRVLLIARGQVVAHGRVREIRDLLHEHPHHIRVSCDHPRKLAAGLLDVEGIVGIRFLSDSTLEVQTRDPDRTYAAIADETLRGGYRLQSITSPDATLEALFHYLVERSSRGAGTGADAAVGSFVQHEGEATA